MREWPVARNWPLARRPTPADEAPGDDCGRRLQAARPGLRAGFLMLEVAVALSVLAIGLVALFALLGTGLDSGTRAAAESRAALFARGALAGLRAESDRAAEAGAWETFWREFAAGTRTMPVPAEDAWAHAAELALRAGALATNLYRNESYHGSAATNIVDHVLRYRLDVELTGPDTGWTNRAAVVLRVWDGEFGSTGAQRAVEFYTEYGRHEL
jgi:Tfp pilus assembly protein PilV